MYKQEFSDKVVLITGGATGIGNATARAFARNSARVIICGRRQDVGQKAVVDAANDGLTLDFRQCDVADHTQVQALIDGIEADYGRLDVAFNNAGVDGKLGILHEADIDDWKRMIDINLSGVFYCLKYQIALMLKNGGGAIINNASVSGHRGYPTLPGYIASKHGLIGLTKSAAMGYAAKGIRINSISPGLIITPMVPEERLNDEKYRAWVKQVEPMQRMASADEVANAVLWLASSQASYTTGHDLAVDGGILAR